MSFPLSVIPVKILNGASLSNQFFIGDGFVAGIVMSAAWTTANLTVQGGLILDETVFPQPAPTFSELYDDAGNEITIDAAAAIQISIPEGTLGAMYGCQWAKLRSGSSGSPVTQGADRQLYVIVQKRHSTNTR